MTYPKAIGKQDSGAGMIRPAGAEALRRTADTAAGQEAAPSLSPEKLRLAKDVAEALRALIEAAEASAAIISSESGEDFARRVQSEGGLTNWMRRIERGIIRRALLESNGNQRRAAMLLGIKATTLSAKMQSLGMR